MLVECLQCMLASQAMEAMPLMNTEQLYSSMKTLPDTTNYEEARLNQLEACGICL